MMNFLGVQWPLPIILELEGLSFVSSFENPRSSRCTFLFPDGFELFGGDARPSPVYEPSLSIKLVLHLAYFFLI